MPTVLRLLVALLLIAAGVLIAVMTANPDAGIAGFEALASDVSVLLVATTGAAMLAGIVANAVWEALKNHAPGGLPVGQVILNALRSAALIRSALVSPIVFIAVYALLKNEPDPVVAHLLAFQNGFFWESVLSKARG